MEELIELVAASFARHGIESSPALNVSGVKSEVKDVHVATAALGCPPERSSAPATRVAEPAALPEHNFRKNLQEICP